MLNFRTCLFALCALLFSSTVNGQQHFALNWSINEEVQVDPEIPGTQILAPFFCEGCKESIKGDYIIPSYIVRLEGLTNVSNIRIAPTSTTAHTRREMHSLLSQQFEVEQIVRTENGTPITHLRIVPMRSAGQKIEVLRSFTLQYDAAPLLSQSSLRYKHAQPTESVLAQGDFYKISTVSDGVYRIDADFLESAGIDVDAVSINSFKIYGNGGTLLPEPIATPRAEDIIENAIFAHDANSNNQLDPEDYFLFYAKGPTSLTYNEASNRYEGGGHYYSDVSHYFITWGGMPGKRIQDLSSNQGQNFALALSTYDHVIFHESNEENHIKSGRRWWGDKMQTELVKTFNYSIAGTVPNSPASFKTITGVRSLSSSSVSIEMSGNPSTTVGHGRVSGEYDEPFIAGPRTTTADFTTPGADFFIRYTYNKTSHDAAAWIDYFVLNVERNLGAYDDQQIIRLFSHEASGDIKLQWNGLGANHLLWNISDLSNVKAQQLFADGSVQSCIYLNTLPANAPEFVLFDRNATYSPSFVKKVANQNLHAIEEADYLIITRSDLLEEAERLADFHRNFNNYTVEVVSTEEVFNEFSSGSQDITGIRDFVKMVYDRGITSGNTLQHVLLFGDASYDYKDVEANNTNVVPIYQSGNSYNPPSSYCSDDYYAILDDNEGYWGISSTDEALDIGVGRLPVSNLDEARVVVDKILHYHSEASLGNWVQTLTFIADDEDYNDHVGPSEGMTFILRNENPEYNIKKIWLDAYDQVSFGSGNKYPDVNAEITKTINNKGTLIFNYVGHGGENGMAHERVVTRPEISSWTNKDQLAFYVTASCELAKIDNLEIESPGELMLLNPEGGAIAMLATTRVVYIGTNTDLNYDILKNNLFNTQNNVPPSLGEAYMNTRNADPAEEINKRCFMLLGDPAIRLHYPKYNVVTTAINGKPIGLFQDTLKALGLVTIEGEVRDLSNAVLPNFNGTLYPTFFDKFSTYKTLGNDPRSQPIDFEMQDRVIYKGQVSVVNGKFSFQFVVPKDIAYNVGNGKLSYYAKDGLESAGGTELNYLIGGTSDSLKNDQEAPTLKLFMDDRSWVFGGTTGSGPQLIADVYDENGINTIGSGIGREMEAILDAGTEHETSIVLNDYYTPKLNSYQEGIIEYPFSELEPGKHTLSLKVWDVYNNSATDYTEFFVSEDGELTLNNVLNYPNPFNNYTEFHFDHNKAGMDLTVNITISTVAGNVVKSIHTTVSSAMSHINTPGQIIEELTWDGRDEFGDQLARGVYLYQLEVRAEDGSNHKVTQKLYLVN